MRWLPIAVVLAAGSAAADEVRLNDGRVVIGEVTRVGERVVVTTRSGQLTFDAAQIESIRTDGELRAELRERARNAGDAPFAKLQLARLARDWGLHKEMWQFTDDAVAGIESTAPGSAIDRLSQRFLASLERELLSDEQRQGDTDQQVRALIRQARPGAGAGRCAAIATALAHLTAGDEALLQEALLKQARRGLLDEQRIAANEALLRRGSDAQRRAVFLNMLIDDDRETRRRIATLVGRLAPTRDALAYVAPAFLHDSPPIRMQAAEVVAAIGDVELGAPLLAAAGPYAGTPRRAGDGNIGVRAHMAATLQTSYISDFDVEIAQAAAVANPVISRLTSGVVLDVKVAAVISQRVQIEKSYRRALRELLGEDPGPDPGAWAAFVAARD